MLGTYFENFPPKCVNSYQHYVLLLINKHTFKSIRIVYQDPQAQDITANTLIVH